MIAVAPDAVTALETFAKHAESAPIIVGFFCFVGLFGGLMYWALFRFWPQWLVEQEKTRALREAEGEKLRAHVAGLMSSRGQEAKEEVAAERSASRERHSEIVGEISTRVERLHDDVRSISRKTGEIAAKLGVPILLLLITVGVVFAKTKSRTAELARRTAYSCTPACPAPAWCCQSGVCCRRAISQEAAHSTTAGIGGSVDPSCGTSPREVCQ